MKEGSDIPGNNTANQFTICVTVWQRFRLKTDRINTLITLWDDFTRQKAGLQEWNWVFIKFSSQSISWTEQKLNWQVEMQWNPRQLFSEFVHSTQQLC